MSIALNPLWPKTHQGPLITGIGSLPHPNVDSALQHAFAMDIPFLPQIPIRNKNEFMITQALEKLPGLKQQESGMSHLDLSDWKSGSGALNEQLDMAFKNDNPEAYEFFEPSNEFFNAWNPFLFELEDKRVTVGKIQLAGPLSCQWATRIEDGSLIDNHPDIGTQIFRLVLARSIAMARRIQKTGAVALLYLDEPGLYVFNKSKANHLMALQELKLQIQTLKKEKILVGLHCCSNTDWDSILGLDLDVLSIDTGLSLQSLLKHESQVQTFLEGGGRLSLGVIPTGRAAQESILAHTPTYFDHLKNVLTSGFSDSALQHHVLSTSLYTPACGLALHSSQVAESILHCLKDFKTICLKYSTQ